MMLSCLLFQVILIFLSGQSLVFGAAIKSTEAVDHEADKRGNLKVSMHSYTTNHTRPPQFNETELLLKAFRHYDDSVPPVLNGEPVEVRPRVSVMSVPLFDEDDFMLRLKLEVVQEWIDWRLDLGVPVAVVLPESYFPMIWLPQLMFENSNAQVDKLFSFYFSLVIHPGGRIVQTIHVSVSTYCKLFYDEYPFDDRICEVTFGSFRYDASRVKYVWPDQNSFPLSFWEEALEPLTEFEFQRFQLSQGVLVSYGGIKYSRLSFKVLATRRPSHIIKSFVIPVGLLVPASWVPTFISENLAARIIAGTTVQGITWAAISNRPRGTTLPVGYDDCVDYYCGAIFLLVASSLFQSAGMLILKKRENPTRRAFRRRQRRHGGRKGCCIRSLGRAIMGCIPYFSRQDVQRANADNLNVEAGEGLGGEVLGEDVVPPAAQQSTSSRCNSWFHILSTIIYVLVLLAMGLHVRLFKHNRMLGFGAPINVIKKADRLMLEII